MGVNHADYQINDDFLKEAGGSDVVQHAEVTVNMELTRSTNMYELKFHLGGYARLICDVCLEEFDMPLDDHHFELIIKISETEQYDDDEIVYITPTAIEFDLTQYLYDSFILSLPIKKECSMSENKECNPEVLKKLIENETDDRESRDENDPRWDKLKGLFKKD